MPEKDLQSLENVPVLIPSCCLQRGLSGLGVSWVAPLPVHLTVKTVFLPVWLSLCQNSHLCASWPVHSSPPPPSLSSGPSACLFPSRLWDRHPSCVPVCPPVHLPVRLSQSSTCLFLPVFWSVFLSASVPSSLGPQNCRGEGEKNAGQRAPWPQGGRRKRTLSASRLLGVAALTRGRDSSWARPGAEVSL